MEAVRWPLAGPYRRSWRNLSVGVLRAMYRWATRSPSFWRLFREAADADSFKGFSIHEKMLSDSVRVDVYQAAIEKFVQAGDSVIDLGTGTGILAFFVASRSPKTVYAVEHGDIIRAAELIARRNGIRGIRFIKSDSKNFVPPEKVDFIIHEQMGSAL